MTATAPVAGNRDVILNVALVALADHACDKGLPAPWDIEYPLDGISPLVVRITGGEAQDAWLESVHVDAHTSEPGVFPGRAWHTWEVRLPDTGVRVTLRGSRPVLEAVAL